MIENLLFLRQVFHVKRLNLWFNAIGELNKSLQFNPHNSHNEKPERKTVSFAGELMFALSVKNKLAIFKPLNTSYTISQSFILISAS